MPPVYEFTRTIPQLPLIPGVNNAMVYEVSAGGVSYRTTQAQVKANILNNPAITGIMTIATDGRMRVVGNNLYIENVTSNQDMYIRANDGGVMTTAIEINASELTDGQTTDAGIIFHRNITFGDTDATLIIPSGAKVAAFASAADRDAIFGFDGTVDFEYFFTNTSGVEIVKIKASSAGESYLKQISQDGNLSTWLQSNDAANTCNVNFGDAADNDAGRIIYNHTTDGMSFYTNAVYQAQITSGGAVYFPNLGAANVANLQVNAANGLLTFPVSARRFKTNINYDLNAKLTSWIYDFPFCTFDMKNGSSKNEIGIIAEDLEKIQPNLVNYDKDGNVMNYSDNPLIITALVELKNINKRLLALEA
jgi:hypothetical protein